jgi:hypothetical protein
VAGATTAAVGVVIVLRGRAMTRATASHEWSERPGPAGSVVNRSTD